MYKQNVTSKMPMIIYNLALSFYKKENYDEAIKYFTQISATQSNNFWYWYRLGVCYYKVYMQKISDKYQKCENDLYTKSKDFPVPLPKSTMSDQPQCKESRTNSMNMNNMGMSNQYQQQPQSNVTFSLVKNQIGFY